MEFWEVEKWLSAAFAVRALHSDTTFLTLTVRQTEPGSLTSVRLKRLLTVLTLLLRFAPVAFVPERSSAHKVPKKLCQRDRVFCFIESFFGGGFMKAVICDGRISPAMERGLQKYGYYVIKLPAAKTLPEGISSHPDSLIFRLGDIFLTTCEYGEDASYVFSDVREFLESSRLYFIDESFEKSYPKDAMLNALSFGKTLIANKKTVAPKILEISEKEGYTLKNVNQGYPNCSILKLDEENAITADAGIYKALCEIGVRTLLISQGHISLPPYDYGFIGGASGVDGDKVFFLGDLSRHPDAEKIESFIKELGMRVICLSDEPLADLGGLIFI